MKTLLQIVIIIISRFANLHALDARCLLLPRQQNIPRRHFKSATIQPVSLPSFVYLLAALLSLLQCLLSLRPKKFLNYQPFFLPSRKIRENCSHQKSLPQFAFKTIGRVMDRQTDHHQLRCLLPVGH